MIALLSFSLMLSLSSFAVTEKDVIHSVLTNYPLIEAAELKAKAAEGSYESAQGSFDHKLKFKSRNRIEDRYDNGYIETSLERQTPYGGLNLYAGHRQGLGHFPAYDGKYRTSSAGEIFAGITMPLLRNLKTDQARTDLALAELDKKIAELEVNFKQNIYLHKGLETYYKWKVVARKVEIRKEMLKIAEERRGMIEKKLKAGDIEKMKLTESERTVEKRKAELAEATIELEQMKQKLSLFLRDPQGEPIMISEIAFPEPYLSNYNAVGFQQELLPQINILDLELKKQSAKKELASQSKLPDLSFDLLGARELSGNKPYDPQRLQVGVRFEFPLENRKASGKTVETEYKVRAIEKEKSYMIQELNRQYDFSVNALSLSVERWKTTSAEFEKTKSLAAAERQLWQQGASDLYMVNLREQDTAEADIKRWSVWFDYHLYYLDRLLFSGRLKDFSEAGSI